MSGTEITVDQALDYWVNESDGITVGIPIELVSMIHAALASRSPAQAPEPTSQVRDFHTLVNGLTNLARAWESAYLDSGKTYESLTHEKSAVEEAERYIVSLYEAALAHRANATESEALRPLWHAVLAEANAIANGHGIGDLTAAILRYASACVSRATAQAPEQPVHLTEPSVERPEAVDVRHEGDAP